MDDRTLPWEQKAAIGCLVALTAVGFWNPPEAQSWSFLIFGCPLVATGILKGSQAAQWLTIVASGILAHLSFGQTRNYIYHLEKVGWPDVAAGQFALACVVLRTVLLIAIPVILTLGAYRRLKSQPAV